MRVPVYTRLCARIVQAFALLVGISLPKANSAPLFPQVKPITSLDIVVNATQVFRNERRGLSASCRALNRAVLGFFGYRSFTAVLLTAGISQLSRKCAVLHPAEGHRAGDTTAAYAFRSTSDNFVFCSTSQRKHGLPTYWPFLLSRSGGTPGHADHGALLADAEYFRICLHIGRVMTLYKRAIAEERYAQIVTALVSTLSIACGK